MHKKHFIIISSLLLLSFISSLHAVDRLGLLSRIYSKAYDVAGNGVPVHILKEPSDVYSLWKRSGFRGRRAVHVGKHVHFLALEDKPRLESIMDSTLNSASQIAEYEGAINYKNFLRVAMLNNVVRQVDYMLPQDDVNKLRSQVQGNDPEAIVKDKVIIVKHLGLNRNISDRLPATSEPVLINIDASYFAYSDPAEFVRQLRESGLTTDMITLCLSEGSPDVTDIERNRLRDFARMLATN